jgi:hypothetical protein
MKNKIVSFGLVAISLMALLPTAANAERYRWNDGVWRTNSVFVKSHPDRRYRPYFKRGRWYSYDTGNHRWNRYRRMQATNNGHWFY